MLSNSRENQLYFKKNQLILSDTGGFFLIKRHAINANIAINKVPQGVDLSIPNGVVPSSIPCSIPTIAASIASSGVPKF